MLSSWIFGLSLIVVVGVCSADENEPPTIQIIDISANGTCVYLDKEFKYGEKIDTPDRACFHCTCRPGWVNPDSSNCAIIDCPWGYYRTKPHCYTEYIQGKCCPELRCSAAPPEQDINYLTRKRTRPSTHGYNITVEDESEITIYCIGDNSTKDASVEQATWTFKSIGSEKSLSNNSHTKIGFFPPATWAIYIDNATKNDDGIYTCTIPTNPPQIQTTRLIVRVDPRPPVIDDICLKPPFNAVNNTECPKATEELPWFYNTTSGDCTQHSELSCSWAKENYFDTMSLCWDHCLDDCFAFPDPGPCKAEMTRYHYDSGSDKCKPFTYGGCRGNGNNFRSEQECEDKCAKIKYRSLNSDSSSTSESPNCKQKCPWNEWLHYLQRDCLAVYDDGSCCPTHFDCDAKKDDPHLQTDDGKCQHEGKSYAVGENILLPELCLSCPCTSGKVDVISSHCKPFGCNLVEMEEKLRNGCIPIYKKDVCCPVDWQCPPKLKTKFRQGGVDTLPSSSQSHCSYGGQNYTQGFTLLTGHSRCLSCECLTPPTFTCIAPTCPDPPSKSDDTLRCNEVYSEEQKCCNDYDCWSILEKTDIVGIPKTEKEKSVCEKNPCKWNQDCKVNYTECHFGECQQNCEDCPVPHCSTFSQYVNPVNLCPYCQGLKTPEQACELIDFCPEGTECVVEKEDDCRHGSCQPVCFLKADMVPSVL